MKRTDSIFAVALGLVLASCIFPPRAHAKQITCEYVSNLSAADKLVAKGQLERLVGASWVVESSTVQTPTTAGKDAALRSVTDFAPGTYTFRVRNVDPGDASRNSGPSNTVGVTVKAQLPDPSGAIFVATLHTDGRWTVEVPS